MVTPSPPRPLSEASTLALSHGGAESNVAVWLAPARFVRGLVQPAR
jgi:hypothetical protein